MPELVIDPPPPNPSSPVKRAVMLTVKILITVLCFWYIATKIDFPNAWRALQNARLHWLLAALLLFLLSKVLSAFRLQIYFRNIGLHLSHRHNLRLYWMGMFYNLFLPGAISGDAYKVILLQRRYKSSYKKLSAAVLLDRFSGVLALGLIGACYGIGVFEDPLLQFLMAAGSLAAIGLFYLVVRMAFKDFLSSFFPTLVWALGVQICQVICIYCILLSLGILPSTHEWIFIFLASAVVSVLPISLGGGLGTRELVFAEGASYFHLNPQTGVVISLLFYLLTLLGSLPGLYFTFRDPLD